MVQGRDMQKKARIIGHFPPGSSTARRVNVAYRLGKLQAHGILQGTWLDLGCAEGGYTAAMIERGVTSVVGLDKDLERTLQAQQAARHLSASYCCAMAEALPFEDENFDGVFLNEVLEHVVDERKTLQEAHRVLKPGGVLAVTCPNRWFPFDGHGMRIFGKEVHFPILFLPWLPGRFSRNTMIARNYWPGELCGLVRESGFKVLKRETIFPVLEFYAWLPNFVIRIYRRLIPTLEKVPLLRKFGVSILVIAERP